MVFKIGAVGWRTALFAGILGLVSSFAQADVTLNAISIPTTIGRGQDANVSVDWTRQDANPGQTITVPLPAFVSVAPPVLPAGCTLIAGPAVQCAIPAGVTSDTGTITFQVRGAALGGFNLTATGTGGSNVTASGDVVSAGDITVTKTKTSPAGNPLAGQATQFSLSPNIAAGGDDVGGGAAIVVTDTLPGTVTDFTLTSVTPTGPVTPSCNTVGRTITCTYSGPFTRANLNASAINILGTPLNTGAFVNVGSIASANSQYFDSNGGNNISNANFVVDPATDLQAQGIFPGANVLINSAQTLTLIYRNNGPLNAPAGGTVATTIPSGFVVGVLPAGCSSAPGIAGATDITCTTGSVSNGNTQSFAIPLTMPPTVTSGNFPISVTSPVGLGDAVAANNSTNVPYSVVAPFADLRAAKSKTPGGPQPDGTVVTTTMQVVNSASSASAADYTVAQPLRVVDYLKPQEVGGGVVTGVTANWSCVVTTGVVPPAFVDAARTTRVACQSTDVGTLAIGATRSVSFSSTLALGGSPTAISLPNTACTGSNVLSALGLAGTDGPQPPDSNTANDCVNDSAGLVVTPVIGSQAQASISKFSSIDNAAFVDAVGSAPTLSGAGDTVYWRMVITTPSVGTNPSQVAIPTLRLNDVIPGRQNTPTTGAPAPSYITPGITVVTTPNTYGSCPNLAAGNASALACTFSNVPPGETITIDLAVQRPMASGMLTNTATLTSPDAVLTASAGGQLSDQAAVIVTPRVDVALTTKSVTPANPRIGEPIQFTITAQNLGPDDVAAAGQFTITDTLNPTATLAVPGYEVLSVSGTGLDCSASNLATGVLSCTNTAAVARYEVRTVTINARIKKPVGVLTSPNAYTAATNTAAVVLSGGYCEFKTEVSTNGLVSTSCNDSNSVSNNSQTALFNIRVPAIDMKQRKERVLPGAQTAFGLGDQLRYRFRVQSTGPSRAENIVMTDRLVVPGGFSVEMMGGPGYPRTVTPLLINAAAAESGFALDATKAASVVCTQNAANADVSCLMSAVVANNYMDAAKEVNFELTFDITPVTSLTPIALGNRAFVCADETAAYESSGACSDVAATAGNNLASVNDTVFPKNDLQVLSKTTITPSPADINQPIRFDIKIKNNGPSDGLKMRIVDTLPTGFEWVNTGPAFLPTAFVDAGSTVVLSGALTVSASVPAVGTANVCFVSNGITSVSTLAQQQAITCDLSGTFGSAAGDTVTVTLYARAKGGLYDGSAGAPYATNRTNSVAVMPGKSVSGVDTAIDVVPGNNTATSTVQIRQAQLSGRVFLDLNNNGDQDGTTIISDQGLGNVSLTLVGTDIYGYAVTRTVTSSNVALGVGSLRGDYLFANLPPSNGAGYTVTETQLVGYGNGSPVPNTARAVRNAVSTGVSGGITASNTVGPITSVIGGVVLAGDANAVQFDFPELPKTSVSGFVYLDADNNGLKGGGDTGINGVSVTLMGCRAGTNGVIDTAGPIGAGPVVCTGDDVAVNLTTVTATDGSLGLGYYLFELDQPGRYSVIEQSAQPQVAGVATVAGKTTAGSVDLLTSLAGSNDGGTAGTANATGVASGGTAGVLQELANTVAVSQIRDIVISSSSAASINNNFGEVLSAQISGVVYTEKAGVNSNFTAGVDWPLPGATANLTGVNDLGQPVNLTVSTNSLGTFSFANLRPGNYQVVKTNPAGIVNELLGAFPGKDAGNTVRGVRVNDDTINAIALTSGMVVSSTNFAVTNGPAPEAVIAAYIYVDRNRNNALDPIENKRLDGVLVNLVDGASCDTGTVIASQLSDGTGSVYFTGQIGRSYFLCEVQPAGYGNGNANGVPGSNSISVPNLALGGSYGNSFGEFSASIAGSVYEDFGSSTPAHANNGVRDLGEKGIANVPVILTGRNILGQLVTLNTATDSSGNYIFEDLMAPDAAGYSITEVLAPAPIGAYQDGKDTAGNASIAPGDATTVNDKVSGIRIAPGEQASGYNFGEIVGASITGLVYIDKDRNNALDATDGGRIAGVTLTLVYGASCETGSVLQTAISDADGKYAFLGVAVGGTYSVCQAQPMAYGNGNAKGNSGSNSILIPNLGVGINTGNDFGELVGSVAGKVFLDGNSNGLVDAAEVGIAGVTVTLSGVDINGAPVTRTTVTDLSGNYQFDDLLAAGNAGYTVTEQLVQPNAPGTTTQTFNGITSAGSIGGVVSGVATSVSTVPSAVSGIALGAGKQSVANNFGEVVINGPDLVVTKQPAKTSFTEGNAAIYTLTVKNVGTLPTAGVYTVTDRLSASGSPAKWNIETASGAGWNCAVSADRQQVSCDSSQSIAASQTAASQISLSVNLGAGSATAGPLLNTVSVAGGGEPPNRGPQPGELSNPPACGSVASENVCQTSTPVQIAAGLSGTVWLDGSNKKVLDSSDKVLPGWVVELFDITAPGATGKSFAEWVRSGNPFRTTSTDSQGHYEFCGLEPGTQYRVLFRDPANRIVFPGVVTNEAGRVTGSEYFSQVVTQEGFEVLRVTLPQAPAGATSAACTITAPQQSLPLDPNGVVYDSKSRQPVPGASVTLVPDGICPGYDPKLHIINYESYANDSAGNPTMTVGSNGFYKFLLSGDPLAPKSCKFRLDVKEPAGYKPVPSTDIPPQPPLATPPAPGIFNVQPQKPAPTGNESTSYYLGVTLGLNHQEIFNNHIPLDRAIPGTFVLSKIGDRKQVTVGDSVLYTIRVRQTAGDSAAQTTVRDRLPAGLTFIRGTVRVNGVAATDPFGGLGPILAFNLGALSTGGEVVLTYRVRVGVGAQQGDGINRAQAHSCQTPAGCVNATNLNPIAGATSSNEGLYQVQVIGGVFTDSACVLGKVFVDCNNNHVQDEEELGIPGVRLYMEDGRYVVTDSEGKYSRCNITPQTHVLKADPATLPTGSRLTTTSSRNLGDAGSLILDLKNGELHRAEFAEGSCSNAVLEQVKARRSQGEVRAIEFERPGGPPLTFKSKPMTSPQQGTDSANQPIVKPRQGGNDAR